MAQSKKVNIVPFVFGFVGLLAGFVIAKHKYHVPGDYDDMGFYFGSALFLPGGNVMEHVKLEKGQIWKITSITGIGGDSVITLGRRKQFEHEN